VAARTFFEEQFGAEGLGMLNAMRADIDKTSKPVSVPA
jgi:hypothetical protein